jgi:hypothetical protein
MQESCLICGRNLIENVQIQDDAPLISTNRTELFYDNSYLRLKYLGMEDAGQYKCVAKNIGGTDEKYMDIIVKGGLINDIILLLIV